MATPRKIKRTASEIPQISFSVKLIGVIVLTIILIWACSWFLNNTDIGRSLKTLRLSFTEDTEVEKTTPPTDTPETKHTSSTETPSKTANTAKPTSSSNSAFEDIGCETIGVVPAKWRVESIPDGVKLKSPPVRFSSGAEFAYVSPAYQLVPIPLAGGVYLMEPGWDSSGGLTVPAAITRFVSEADILQSSIAELNVALNTLISAQKPDVVTLPNPTPKTKTK